MTKSNLSMSSNLSSLSWLVIGAVCGLSLGYGGSQAFRKNPVKPGVSVAEAQRYYHELRDAKGKHVAGHLNTRPMGAAPQAPILADAKNKKSQKGRSLASAAVAPSLGITGANRFPLVNGVRGVAIELRFVCSSWLYMIYGSATTDPALINPQFCQMMAQSAANANDLVFTQSSKLPIQFYYSSTIEPTGYLNLMGTNQTPKATRIASANAGRMPGFVITDANIIEQANIGACTNGISTGTLCTDRTSTYRVPLICSLNPLIGGACDATGTPIWTACSPPAVTNTSPLSNNCQMIGYYPGSTIAACIVPCYCKARPGQASGLLYDATCGLPPLSPFTMNQNGCGCPVNWVDPGGWWATAYSAADDITYLNTWNWLNANSNYFPSVGEFKITTLVRPLPPPGGPVGASRHLFDVGSKYAYDHTVGAAVQYPQTTPDNYFNLHGVIAMVGTYLQFHPHEVGHILGALHERSAWTGIPFYNQAGFNRRPGGASYQTPQAAAQVATAQSWTFMSTTTSNGLSFPVLSSSMPLQYGIIGNSMDDNRTRVGETLNFLTSTAYPGQVTVAPATPVWKMIPTVLKIILGL